MENPMSTNNDHAIVNLPLSKRGDIDAQIDRHKANLKAEARARAKVTHAERIAARQIVVELQPERLASFAARLGATMAQTKKRLLSEARFNPGSVIRAFGSAV